MVKMVWLMKQPFSCFGRFKIRARLGLGLIGRVGAVTTLGCSASPRWSRVRAWPGVAASGLAVARLPLAPPRGAVAAAACPVTKPLPTPSPHRRVRTLLPYLALLLPMPPQRRAVLLPLALPPRACGLSRLRSCCRLALMALRLRRPCPHLPPRARTWSGRVSRSECADMVAGPTDR